MTTTDDAAGSVPAPPGVIVLGMHRSGTSAVTHVLSTLGLAVAEDQVGADWSNPDGHWESWRLIEINNRLLAAAGGSWDDPRPVPAVLDDQVLRDAARAAFDAVLPRSPWVWKDPRTSFTLPFWRNVLADGDTDTSPPPVVVCLRNPLEVAASLERRNGFPRAKGLDLWGRYTRAWLSAVEGLPVFPSHYEDFVERPDEWCRAVVDFLHETRVITVGAADVAARVKQIMRPTLRRHRFVADDVHRADDVTGEHRALYSMTRALTSTADFRQPSLDSWTASAVAPPLYRESGRTVWVAGFPSRYGGADTELDHFVDLLLMHDVEVNLVPNFAPADAMVRSVLERGAVIHEYRPDIFRDRTVVSFCNGEFLRRLPEIISAGRPRQVVWFNCMTWTFDAELEAHANGWIDYFGFESAYQRDYLGPQIEAVAPYRTFGYRPFFDVRRVAWDHRDYNGTYRVGRISRDDSFKYAEDTWQIFDRVLVPRDLSKKVYILGYGPHAQSKIGAPPPGMDWLTWSPDAISSTEFYRTVDTLVHKTGGSRESYGRVVVEAYAHGVVPVVEDAYAFGELVVSGETGFRGATSDEMSHYASVLAFDPALHKSMAAAGRELLETLCDPEECFIPWLDVL